MHKLASIFKHGSLGQPTASLPPDDTPFPSVSDLYRHRKQRGVNLGCWFVLERWIADTPFQSASSPGQSDLDVARGANARQILEQHWDTWITEQDWVWIADKGINSVRIPIGYYHICGADPSVLHGTEFADFQHVFEGAWQRITSAIATASKFGVGVLIDLHAAPGKQNGDAHSGSSSQPSFFTARRNMPHTTHVLRVLLAQLTAFARSRSLSNIVGIELLNESQPGPHNGALEKWYLDTIHALREVDATIPVYIGDSWMTDQYADFLSNACSGIPFVVLDHHLYRCFTGGDGATSAAQHIQNLLNPNDGTPQMFARVSQKLEGAGKGFVVGEWSGALNPGSLHGVQNEDQARGEYVKAQLALYERCCAGYFFWTYKKEHGRDAGWSFRDAVDAGLFPRSVGLKPKVQMPTTSHDESRDVHRDQRRDKALNAHTSYWSQYPGKYEHWRFGDGFMKGWDDAWLFFESDALAASSRTSELGFKGPWAKRRSEEHARVKGNGNLWEFEHGFSQGVTNAREEFVDMYC